MSTYINVFPLALSSDFFSLFFYVILHLPPKPFSTENLMFLFSFAEIIGLLILHLYLLHYTEPIKPDDGWIENTSRTFESTGSCISLNMIWASIKALKMNGRLGLLHYSKWMQRRLRLGIYVHWYQRCLLMWEKASWILSCFLTSHPLLIISYSTDEASVSSSCNTHT